MTQYLVSHWTLESAVVSGEGTVEREPMQGRESLQRGAPTGMRLEHRLRLVAWPVDREFHDNLGTGCVS